MTDLDPDTSYWFRAKKYGYGAGLPLTWQGWVTLGLYLVGLAGIGFLDRQQVPAARIIAFALFVVMTGFVMALCRHHTKGGWKWRWGNGD
jgi:hypothetical protein